MSASNNGSTFSKFYDRWGGIIRSGDNIDGGSNHFLEQYAHFKLANDDDNLKFARSFERIMNKYRLETDVKRPIWILRL